MQITFACLIKKLEIKSLASLDKGGRLTLDFSAEEDEVVNSINALMKADESVEITIRAQGE